MSPITQHMCLANKIYCRVAAVILSLSPISLNPMRLANEYTVANTQHVRLACSSDTVADHTQPMRLANEFTVANHTQSMRLANESSLREHPRSV